LIAKDIPIWAERIRKARERKNLTQIEAAKLIGITNGALSNYERGERQPDIQILRKMAKVYGVSLSFLAGENWWERDEPPSDVELEEFIKTANIRLMGDPLDEEAKDDLLVAMKAAWAALKQQREKKRAAEAAMRDKRDKRDKEE